MKIHRKLARTDRTDPFKKEGAAVVSVDAYDVVDLMRIGCKCEQLKIHERHMIG